VTSPDSVNEDARERHRLIEAFRTWRETAGHVDGTFDAFEAGYETGRTTQSVVTEEEVEAAARAFIDGWAEDVNDVECPSWDERDDDDQAFWLSHMRAALEVAARIRTDRETA
jgi:hypothetical protein